MTTDRRLNPRISMGGRPALLHTDRNGGRRSRVQLLDMSVDGARWSSDAELELPEGSEVALSVRLARLVGRLTVAATIVRHGRGEQAAQFAAGVERSRLVAYLERAYGDQQVSGGRSPIAHAIRQLAVTFDRGTTAQPRLLLVTSARSWEGKSFIAAGVAAAAAATGQRVLLVDADFRAPTQHLVFGTKGAPGLSQLLAGTPFEAASMLQATRYGVALLAAGAAPSRPALFGASAIAGTFGALRSLGFGFIVVDTSSLLESADALVLGRHADDVIVTARSGTTRERDLRRAIDLLRQHGVPVGGVVLNDHLDVALGATGARAAFAAGVAGEPLSELLASMATATGREAALRPVLT